MNARGINNLAVGTNVASGSQTLLVSNGLRQPRSGLLARLSKASMRGVGTALGTVEGTIIAGFRELSLRPSVARPASLVEICVSLRPLPVHRP